MIKRVFTYIMTVLLLCNLCVPLVYADESTDTGNSLDGCKGIDAKNPYLGTYQLTENVASAFLYELNSDTLMYAWNEDTPQYPASLVKIMNVLIVLENAELSEIVTVSQTALDSVSQNAISVYLVAGEQITVENLMYCMMVKSANDAAAVLAEFVAGSQEAFVSLMNDKATELGCLGTNFTNAHGLHDDLQVTTARDMCIILKAALEYDFFRTVFGTVHYTVPATNHSEERIISTNNFLMNDDPVAIYYDPRVTGGRTGVTTDGFRCIASVAENRNMELICIVMGSASTFLDNGSTDVYGGFPETISLLNYGFENNDTYQVLFENQVLRQQAVLNGDCNIYFVASDSAYAVLPADCTLDDLLFSYPESIQSLEAPIQKGQSLGTLCVMYDGICVAETEVFSANDVPALVSKAAPYVEPEKKGTIWIVLLVVIVMLLAAAVVFIRFRKRKQPVPDYNDYAWREIQ